MTEFEKYRFDYELLGASTLGLVHHISQYEAGTSGLSPMHARMTALDGSASVEPDRTVLSEPVTGGWRGVAKIKGGDDDGILDAFEDVSFESGQPILITLEEENSAADPVQRYWPSVVTGVATTTGEDGRAFSHVEFQDTVTYLSNRPVWGAFSNCSLGEAVGGAMSLAANGDGRASVRPSTPGLPAVNIQTTEAAQSRMPRVVASGESLGVLLTKLFRQLGVRMEVSGTADSMISVALQDGPPADVPYPIHLRAGIGEAGAGGRFAEGGWSGILVGRTVLPQHGNRDTVLDNPSTGATKRVVGRGSVGQVLTGAEMDLGAATNLSKINGDHDYVLADTVHLLTSLPRVAPGKRIVLDAAIEGEDDWGGRDWQVGAVLHLMGGGAYVNTSRLARDGRAWRQSSPGPYGAAVLPGVVDDGASDRGTPVARDRLGRIPVSLPMGPGGGVTEILRVPVVYPVAGGNHGFVPQHRQGDRVRLAVNSPLDVEVVGFLYDDGRGVAAEVGTGSGIVVDHEAEWAGMLFRPATPPSHSSTSGGEA